MRAPDLESVPAPCTKERPIEDAVEEARALLLATLARYEQDLRSTADPWTARYLAEVSTTLGRALGPKGYCSRGHLRETPNQGRKNRCKACSSAQSLLRSADHEDFIAVSTSEYARLIQQHTVRTIRENDMSYDIRLELPNPGREPVEVFWINYTSNMSKAWRAAGIDFHDFHGRLASDMEWDLARAIEAMEKNFDDYASRFDSPNGWGSMKTLLPVLHRLLDEGLRAYPGATVSVCA